MTRSAELMQMLLVEDSLAGIRADDSLRRIPVAVLTTSSAEKDVVQTYDLGGNCYLTKPVDVDQFVHVVQSIEDFWLGLVRLPPRQGRTPTPRGPGRGWA